MRVADYIMQRLVCAGVRHVFQVTGRGALFLNDAVAKHADLTPVSLHHEQACAFAAIGYAEQTERIGVCLVSTGCAATNTLTGVLSAWQDAVPCIFISGQHILRETSRFTGIPLRTYGQQEADIVSLVSPMTKYATMLTAPEDIEEVMEKALWHAQTGRKGPVWLDIPLDLQSALMPLGRAVVSPHGFDDRPLPKEEDVQNVVVALRTAQRPVALIGSGVRAARAHTQLKEFVERWKIPVTYTAAAPDSYGTAHPLSIGSVGAMGCSRAGNFAVQNADFVLVLGSRLTALTTGSDFDKFARAARVAVVDIDPVEHSKKSIRIDQLIHSDLGLFLTRLNQMEAHSVAASWISKCQHWKQLFRQVEPEFSCSHAVDLYELAECLSEVLPNPSTFVTDSGLAEVILPTNIRFADGMKCIHPTSQGAMGFALPAAIGAQHANAQPVVVVVGDGSIMMNLQELETIRYQKLPIKIIVVNNNGYAIIRRRQRELFRHRTIGTDPDNGVSCTDFSRVADCFGLQYSRVEHPRQMTSALTAMLTHDGPVLCEVMGRVDQGYIELGQARSARDHRFIRRPLEDQEPYLSRDLFLNEMVVSPIDQ